MLNARGGNRWLRLTGATKPDFDLTVSGVGQKKSGARTGDKVGDRIMRSLGAIDIDLVSNA